MPGGLQGKVRAVLEVQLGPPSATRPGPPEGPHQAVRSQKQQKKDILPLGARRRQVLGSGDNEGRLSEGASNGRSTGSTTSCASNSWKKAVQDGSGGRFGFSKRQEEILKRFQKRAAASARVQAFPPKGKKCEAREPDGRCSVQRILEQRRRNDSKPGGLPRYYITVLFGVLVWLVTTMI